MPSITRAILWRADFFNLEFTQIYNNGLAGPTGTGFTRQFDSHADRANADFDQRHNAVGYAIWDIPAWTRYKRAAPLFRHWTIAAVGAARSGFPFSVFVPAAGLSSLPPGSAQLENNRANLVDPSALYAPPAGPTNPGMQFWLNGAAFQVPSPGTTGNTGRNEFRGPGLYSLDVAVHRSVSIKVRDRQARITVRADAFNVLNHANLNNPDGSLTSSNFGMSTVGRMGQTTGFPASAPFNETPRQIQLMLRLEF